MKGAVNLVVRGKRAHGAASFLVLGSCACSVKAYFPIREGRALKDRGWSFACRWVRARAMGFSCAGVFEGSL